MNLPNEAASPISRVKSRNRISFLLYFILQEKAHIEYKELHRPIKNAAFEKSSDNFVGNNRCLGFKIKDENLSQYVHLCALGPSFNL